MTKKEKEKKNKTGRQLSDVTFHPANNYYKQL